MFSFILHVLIAVSHFCFLIAAVFVVTYKKAAIFGLFFKKEWSVAFGTWFWIGFLPGDKVAGWIIAASVENSAFFRSLWGNISAVFWAFDANAEGFGCFAFWICRACHKTAKPSGFNHHRAAAVGALFVCFLLRRRIAIHATFVIIQRLCILTVRIHGTGQEFD